MKQQKPAVRAEPVTRPTEDGFTRDLFRPSGHVALRHRLVIRADVFLERYAQRWGSVRHLRRGRSLSAHIAVSQWLWSLRRRLRGTRAWRAAVTVAFGE